MLSRVSVRAYATAPVKIVSRDSAGSLSTLSVKIANAGSKSGKAGLAHLLAKYAFLNTETKSALRFTRESELLGGSFESQVTRDAIVLRTQFLKQDLPYYVNLLASTLAHPLFRPFEFSETVVPVAVGEAAAANADNAFVALEALHSLSFRRGYGNPLYYSAASPVSYDDVVAHAPSVYTQGNVSLVASGVNADDLATFVADSAFADLPAGSTSAPAVTTRTGGETRVAAPGASVAAIAVPVLPKDFALYEVLAAAVGTSVLPDSGSPLAQIQGADAKLYKYEDAGLFVVSVKGAASAVASGIKAAKKTLESVTAAQLKAATKNAELSVALQQLFEYPHDIAVSANTPAASLGAFNYVAVGNTDVLPFADEL